MTEGELGRSWKSFGGDRGRVWRKGRRGQQSLGGQRGQSNFELAANFGYDSRGSADPRESLRKRRILKLALTAHKVSKPPDLCLPPAEHPDGQTSRSLVFSLTNN